MNAVFFICGIVSIAAVLLITIYMIIAGIPAIREVGIIDFLFGTVWQSTASDPKFGILPFILTSIWGTLGAVIIGVPIGLFTAIYLAKMAPPMTGKSFPRYHDGKAMSRHNRIPRIFFFIKFIGKIPFHIVYLIKIYHHGKIK